MKERQALLGAPAAQWDVTQVQILDAADQLLQRRGVHGMTVAELARRSGLSRPTIYRSWSDADDVVRSALLRRVTAILAQMPTPRTRGELVDRIMEFVERFRTDAVYARLLDDEPESFTRYTLQRVGSSQRMILGWLAAGIAAAQHGGSVRAGDAEHMAVMLLLIAQSAVLSHSTVAELIDESSWSSELRCALDGHLRP